jgi:hypothetical protein
MIRAKTSILLLLFIVILLAHPAYGQRFSIPKVYQPPKTVPIPKSDTWQKTPIPSTTQPNIPGGTQWKGTGDMFGSGIFKGKPVEVPHFNYTPSIPGTGTISIPKITPTVPGFNPLTIPLATQQPGVVAQPGVTSPTAEAVQPVTSPPTGTPQPIPQKAAVQPPVWDEPDPKSSFEGPSSPQTGTTMVASNPIWDPDPPQIASTPQPSGQPPAPLPQVASKTPPPKYHPSFQPGLEKPRISEREVAILSDRPIVPGHTGPQGPEASIGAGETAGQGPSTLERRDLTQKPSKITSPSVPKTPGQSPSAPGAIASISRTPPNLPIWDTQPSASLENVPLSPTPPPQYELIRPPSSTSLTKESLEGLSPTPALSVPQPGLKTKTKHPKDKPGSRPETKEATIERLRKLNCEQIQTDLNKVQPQDSAPWNQMMREKGCFPIARIEGSSQPLAKPEQPRTWSKPAQLAKTPPPVSPLKPQSVLGKVSTSLIEQIELEEKTKELYKALGMNPPTSSWPKDTLDTISQGIGNQLKTDEAYVDKVGSIAGALSGYTGPGGFGDNSDSSVTSPSGYERPKTTNPAMLVKPPTKIEDRGKITDVEILDRITKPGLTQGEKDKVADKMSKGQELTEKERESLNPALQYAYLDGKVRSIDGDPTSSSKLLTHLDQTTRANLDAIDPSQAVNKWDGVSPPQNGQANDKGQIYSQNYGKWVDKQIFDMDKKIAINQEAQKQAGRILNEQAWNKYYQNKIDPKVYNAGQSMASVLMKDKILDKTKLYKDGLSADQVKIMENQINKAIAGGALPQDLKAIVQNHYKQFLNEQAAIKAEAEVDEYIADSYIQGSKMGIIALTSPLGVGGAAIGMGAFGYVGSQEGSIIGGLKEGLGYYVPGANSYQWYKDYQTGKATIKDLQKPLLFDLLTAVGLKGDIAAAKQGNLFGGLMATAKTAKSGQALAAAGEAGKLAATKEVENIIATAQKTLINNPDDLKIISATPDGALKGIDAILENAKNLANSEYATLAAQVTAKGQVSDLFKAIETASSQGKPLGNDIKTLLGNVLTNKYAHDILKGGSTGTGDILKFNNVRNTAVDTILTNATQMAKDTANKSLKGTKYTVIKAEPVKFTNPPKPGDPPKIDSDLDVGMKITKLNKETGEITTEWMKHKDWGKCLNESTYNYFGRPPVEKFDPKGLSRVYGKDGSGGRLSDAETFTKMLDFNATDPFHVESYGRSSFEADSVLKYKEELFTVENYANTFYVKGKERLNMADDFFTLSAKARETGNWELANLYLAEGNRNVKEGIYQIQKQIDKQVIEAVNEVHNAAKMTGQKPPRGIPENITKATDLTKNIGKVDPYSGHIITPQEIEMEIKGLGFKDYKDLTEKSKFYIDGIANYVKTTPAVKGLLEARGWTRRVFNMDDLVMTSPSPFGMRIQ